MKKAILDLPNAAWILPIENATTPAVHAYRLRFNVTKSTRLRFYVTADERYALYLDGTRIGRGPERGDARNWFCEYHDLAIKSGAHTIVAQVWALGKDAPLAQMTVRPGFLLIAEGPDAAQLTTGQALWEVMELKGLNFLNLGGRIPKFYAVGADLEINGTEFSWGFERGIGERWKAAVTGEKPTGMSLWGDISGGRLVQAGTLPPMMDRPMPAGIIRHVQEEWLDEQVLQSRHSTKEAPKWQAFIEGSGHLTVQARSRRRVLIDLETYACAYSALRVSGGAGSRITLRWAEALYIDSEGKEKGNRNEIEGRYFIGIGDRFLPEGGEHRLFEPLWWRCGRYLQLEIETAGKPLKLESLELRETRYPLEPEVEFNADDARWKSFCEIAVRALQMCAHETYYDCPYFEQLMYTGDTRIMMLCQYVISGDSKLPRKAIELYDASRDGTGLTASRYPGRGRQVIPAFSLWWIAMVHDYALWRGDPEFIRARMPGVRSVLEAWLHLQREDGLVDIPPGWRFQDWVPQWAWGTPPEADKAPSACFNWQVVLALNLAADLELWMGEKELAARATRRGRQIAQAAASAFWSPRRGLFADDLKHRHYSEHAQCLAILSHGLKPDQAGKLAASLIHAKKIAPVGIFFSHYLFEACSRPDLATPWFERLEPWVSLAGNGFKTTPEYWQSTSRSDCHAWGAHPLYHLATSILGIRPGGMGFSSVTINPMPGPLKEVSGAVVHPKGLIRVELTRKARSLRAKIELPENLRGSFAWEGTRRSLKPGKQELAFL